VVASSMSRSISSASERCTTPENFRMLTSKWPSRRGGHGWKALQFSAPEKGPSVTSTFTRTREKTQWGQGFSGRRRCHDDEQMHHDLAKAPVLEGGGRRLHGASVGSEGTA
jgi:hypothetical protein